MAIGLPVAGKHLHFGYKCHILLHKTMAQPAVYERPSLALLSHTSTSTAFDKYHNSQSAFTYNAEYFLQKWCSSVWPNWSRIQILVRKLLLGMNRL